MALSLQHPNFTPPHRLAQPLDVFDWNSSIPTAVVDDDRACDVHVAEADGVSAFEADEEVDGWVGACGGEFPDGVGEAEVVGDLAFFICHGIDCRS